MPVYKVVARRGGQIELLAGERADDVKLNDGDVEVGEFHAENEAEAWRQLATANPQIDMDRRRVRIEADADAALAEQKREFEEKVRQETISNLVVPDDTGAAEEEDEEEEVEEDDPDNPGQKRKTKRKTGRKVKKSRAKKGSKK